MTQSLVSTSQGFFSPRTFAWAKQIVARVTGSQNSPNIVGAGDALLLAIDELNEYNWESHSVTGADVAVVAGTDVYDLPTPFKANYSLRLSQPVGRPLIYIRKQDWDLKDWSHTLTGEPVAYTMWNAFTSGKLQLIPNPSSDCTMEYTYYRPISYPTADNETLDVRPWMVSAIILKAQVHFGTWNGLEGNKLGVLLQRAEDALRGAISADRNPPTEDATFQSGVEWRSPGYPIDHAQFWINGGWD